MRSRAAVAAQERAAQIPWHRLSPRARETYTEIAPLMADWKSRDEVANALGLTADAVSDAMNELRAEVEALAEGAALPPLTLEEEDALRASLQQLGQLVPVLVDERGRPLDGEHRLKLMAELGIEPELRVIDTRGDAALRHDIKLAANTVRRTLSASSRRKAIEAELVRDPARSDRSIAAVLGVNHHAVANARSAAEAKGVVLRLDKRVGADGVEQPARKPRQSRVQESPRERERTATEECTLDPTDTAGGRLGFIGRQFAVHVAEGSWVALGRPLSVRVTVVAAEGA